MTGRRWPKRGLLPYRYLPSRQALCEGDNSGHLVSHDVRDGCRDVGQSNAGCRAQLGSRQDRPKHGQGAAEVGLAAPPFVILSSEKRY